MDWTGILTLAIAATGLILSVCNVVWFIWRDRVRLRVKAHTLIDMSSGLSALSVEVVNLSYFAVTINEVGFLPRWDYSGRRAIVQTAILPSRLDARASLSIIDPSGELLPLVQQRQFRAVRAVTACGVKVNGRIK